MVLALHPTIRHLLRRLITRVRLRLPLIFQLRFLPLLTHMVQLPRVPGLDRKDPLLIQLISINLQLMNQDTLLIPSSLAPTTKRNEVPPMT